MDNKNGKNAFASTTLGGSDKYLKRHQDALRLERAADFDKRIAEFDAQKHTLDWARKAVDFCNREYEAGKDVADISKGVQDLARIRQEAQDIIKLEDDRLKAEKEALKLKQQQIDLKNKEDEDAAVSNLERLIDNISLTSRTREWLDEVQRINLTVKGLPAKVFDRVSNRFLIDGFNKEAPDLEMALELDSQILELNATRQKNKSWAQKVFDLEKKLSPKYDKYMKEKNAFFNLASLASKVYYSVEIASIESFLKKVEEGQIEQVMDDYLKVSKNVEKLRDAIYIEEYISNFESRWVDAKEQADAIVKENNRVAAEQLKAKKKAEKEQEEIAIKNAQKAEKAKIVRAKLLKAFIVLLHLAVIGGVIGFGVLNISSPVGVWVLTGGGSAIWIYFWMTKLSFWMKSNEVLRNLVVGLLFGVPTIGLNIAGMFIETFGFYFTPLLAALIAMSIFDFVTFGDDEDLHCGGVMIDVSLITLGFMFFVSIGGILGALLCAACLIAMGVVHAVVVHVLGWEDVYMYTLAIILFVASAVPIWWGRWDTLILSLALAIGGSIVGFANTDNDEFVPGTIAAIIIYSIVFVFGLIVMLAV